MVKFVHIVERMNQWLFLSSQKLPTLQAGGFSANAQPIDQVHHLLRSRLDHADAADLGCAADVRARESFLV